MSVWLKEESKDLPDCNGCDAKNAPFVFGAGFDFVSGGKTFPQSRNLWFCSTCMAEVQALFIPLNKDDEKLPEFGQFKYAPTVGPAPCRFCDKTTKVGILVDTVEHFHICILCMLDLSKLIEYARTGTSESGKPPHE